MRHYSSTKEQVVNAIIPSNQIVALVTTSAQEKMQPNFADDMTLEIKQPCSKSNGSLKTDNVCMCNGLASVGSKLCAEHPKTSIPEEPRL